MQNKINNIINSGDLEAYLLGDLDAVQTKKIEQYITLYPEVKKAFDQLQLQLESFSNTYRKTPPTQLKDSIEKQIRRIDRFTRFSWIAVAASILVFFGTSFFMFQENQKLEAQQQLVDTQIGKLTQSFDNQLEELRNQFILLNSPKTKKIILDSHLEEKELKLIAYINSKKRLSYLQFDSLPELPKNKCYQLWIERNGSKQSIGILPATVSENLLIRLPYKKNAVAYLSIEDRPGNLNPKAKKAIVNIPIG